MVDLPTFLVNYPEFTAAPPGMVKNALNDAYLLTPATTWNALQDQGAQLRAAQAIALSPYGTGLQLAQKDGKTTYDSRLDRLIAIVAAGGTIL